VCFTNALQSRLSTPGPLVVEIAEAGTPCVVDSMGSDDFMLVVEIDDAVSGTFVLSVGSDDFISVVEIAEAGADKSVFNIGSGFAGRALTVEPSEPGTTEPVPRTVDDRSSIPCANAG
jgi:hypothetical protein